MADLLTTVTDCDGLTSCSNPMIPRHHSYRSPSSAQSIFVDARTAQIANDSLDPCRYKAAHNGTAWPYKHQPYIHQLYSPRWHGQFSPVRQMSDSRQTALFNDPGVLKLAITRNPLQRMISAWRSKLKCEVGSEHGADILSRVVITKQLLRLLPDKGLIRSQIPGLLNRTLDYERTVDRPCLYFNEYVEVLAAIHQHSRAHLLNEHFKPQQYLCFKKWSLQDWGPSNVVDVNELANHTVLAAIATRFGVSSHDGFGFPKVHTTNGVGTDTLKTVFPESVALLESLVQGEQRAISTESAAVPSTSEMRKNA
eukprot:m.173990 g.173990  ORF g.173990 m.173990 type:complete len:310 (-) comp24344_c0_seq1:320-1249(-)